MKIRTLSAFFIAVLFGSCTHYYYVPNTQNVPLFMEKNEYRASLSIGGGGESEAVDGQFAYSVTNHFAVMTNFMYAQGGKDSGNNWAKGKFIEGAIGYYKPFKTNGVFEIYGGYGGGNQHHQYGEDNINRGKSDLSFTRIFLQPSVGITFKGFDFALSTRVCRLDFNKIDFQTATHGSAFHEMDAIAHNKTSYLLEPAFTIRGGWKYVKLQFQLMSSKNLTNPNLNFEPSRISFGVYFTIADRYRKNDSEKSVDF
jgi:hypothetical protein